MLHLEVELGDPTLQASQRYAKLRNYEGWEAQAEKKAGEDAKQVHSIEDQIEVCQEYADATETAMNDIADDIAKIDKTLNDSNSIKMTKEDFLSLLATSAEKLKNGTFAEKDAIARIWLLNLRIEDKKRSPTSVKRS